jgi:hypothetical protein
MPVLIPGTLVAIEVRRDLDLKRSLQHRTRPFEAQRI